jgi:hypothetical protein
MASKGSRRRYAQPRAYVYLPFLYSEGWQSGRMRVFVVLKKDRGVEAMAA